MSAPLRVDLVDPSKAFKNAYLLRAQKAAWPSTATSADLVYSSLQRVFLGERDRRPLIQKLLDTAQDWDRQCLVLLQDQTAFDAWLFSEIESICELPFAWSQKPKKNQAVVMHEHLSFGAAQKFVNLGFRKAALLLKDWWALSKQAIEQKHLPGPEIRDADILYQHLRVIAHLKVSI